MKELEKELKRERVCKEHLLGGGGSMPCRGLLVTPASTTRGQLYCLSQERKVGGTTIMKLEMEIITSDEEYH